MWTWPNQQDWDRLEGYEHIRDEISIHDNINPGNEGDESDNTVEDKGPSNQLFYDASDELEEYNESQTLLNYN